MNFLIGFAYFPFIVWATVTLCTKKGWPLSTGLLIGILLQPIGYVVAWLLVLGVGRFVGIVPAVFLMLLVPVVAGLLPITVATLMPQNPDADSQQGQDKVEFTACPACGRTNAVTTRVCPRCGNRFPET